jgi:hypothetical protein
MNLSREMRLVLVALTSLLFGCATAAIKPVQSSTPSTTDSSLIENVTGVWQGSTFADCPIVTTSDPGRCGAMQHITLTMFQQGQGVSGSYKCRFGNENCRDLAETGVIRNGQMTARLLRIAVMLEDGTMCRFTGMPQNGILEGRYQCHWGGPMERGAFHVERSY